MPSCIASWCRGSWFYGSSSWLSLDKQLHREILKALGLFCPRVNCWITTGILLRTLLKCIGPSNNFCTCQCHWGTAFWSSLKVNFLTLYFCVFDRWYSANICIWPQCGQVSYWRLCLQGMWITQLEWPLYFWWFHEWVRLIAPSAAPILYSALWGCCRSGWWGAQETEPHVKHSFCFLCSFTNQKTTSMQFTFSLYHLILTWVLRTFLNFSCFPSINSSVLFTTTPPSHTVDHRPGLYLGIRKATHFKI